MKSLRAPRGGPWAVVVLLASVAHGQIYPASSTLSRIPPVDLAPVYEQPRFNSQDPSTWMYGPPVSVAYPRTTGVTGLIGTPPVNLTAAEPVPQMIPQPAVVAAPNNVPSFGKPTQRDYAGPAPTWSAPATPCMAPAMPYAVPGNPCAVATPSLLDSFGAKANVCGACGQQPCCCVTPWFIGVYGLFMARDNDNPYMFSYDTANEARQLTNSRDANFDWAGGIDIHFGRYFNCGQNAVEGVYWGIYPGGSSGHLPGAGQTLTTAGDVVGSLNGILNWGSLTYNGATADTWVNNAQAHAVFRESEIHNVEFNLLQFCGACPQDVCSGSRLQYHWLAGVRYFDFRDELVFGADTVNQDFSGAPEEIYYRIQTDNNLIGLQVGSEAEYAVTARLAMDCGLKLGVYGNHIVHDSVIGGAAGNAVINNGPNLGQSFAVHGSKNDVALLGELNLGLQYCLNRNWTARGGYRAVAVTGVALPCEQIYPDLRGIQDVEVIDSNGSLILHGAYAGLEYNF